MSSDSINTSLAFVGSKNSGKLELFMRLLVTVQIQKGLTTQETAQLDFSTGAECCYRVELNKRVVMLRLVNTFDIKCDYNPLLQFNEKCVVLLLYNSADRSTFSDLERVIDVSTDMLFSIFIVAITFLSPSREVSKEEGMKFAEENGAIYIELSNNLDDTTQLLRRVAEICTDIPELNPSTEDCSHNKTNSDSHLISYKRLQFERTIQYANSIDIHVLNSLVAAFPSNLEYDSLLHDDEKCRCEILVNENVSFYFLWTLKNMECDPQQLSILLRLSSIKHPLLIPIVALINGNKKLRKDTKILFHHPDIQTCRPFFLEKHSPDSYLVSMFMFSRFVQMMITHGFIEAIDISSHNPMFLFFDSNDLMKILPNIGHLFGFIWYNELHAPEQNTGQNQTEASLSYLFGNIFAKSVFFKNPVRIFESCFNEDPNLRPSFSEVEKELKKLIPKDITKKHLANELNHGTVKLLSKERDVLFLERQVLLKRHLPYHQLRAAVKELKPTFDVVLRGGARSGMSSWLRAINSCNSKLNVPYKPRGTYCNLLFSLYPSKTGVIPHLPKIDLVVLFFDANSKESFQFLDILVSQVHSEIPIYLIATNLDSGRKVEQTEIQSFITRNYIVGFSEISAKLNVNIEESTEAIARACFEHFEDKCCRNFNRN